MRLYALEFFLECDDESVVPDTWEKFRQWVRIHPEVEVHDFEVLELNK